MTILLLDVVFLVLFFLTGLFQTKKSQKKIMLKIKKQPYDSVWISADSQKELGETFIRFQEYYENPSRKFRNKIFTLGDITVNIAVIQ